MILLEVQTGTNKVQIIGMFLNSKFKGRGASVSSAPPKSK